MSFRYKVLERCIKAVDIKKLYSMPEEKLLSHLKTNYRAYDLPEFLYKQFRVEKKELDGRLLFKIQPKEYGNENVILFIHGGGGMMCPTLLHYRFAARLVKNTGAAMYFPFYPLGPEASIFDSMEWLDKVFAEVLKNYPPEKITIIGDSAGAALSISLCRRSRIKTKGIVLISPAVGIEKPYDKMLEMEKYDLILSVRTVDIIKKHWLKGASFEGADFNTSSADYTGFPPVQLYYGTNELFYPHINSLIDKIKAGGGGIETIEGKGLCHDWAIIGIIPEGRDALMRICKFIMD